MQTVVSHHWWNESKTERISVLVVWCWFIYTNGTLIHLLSWFVPQCHYC